MRPDCEPMLWQVVQQPRLVFRLEDLARRLKHAIARSRRKTLPAKRACRGNETLRQPPFTDLAGELRRREPGASCRSFVTGAAGFIGFHVAKALLERGDRVIGIDNLNEYYDVRLKEARLAELRELSGFSFAKLDVADRDRVFDLVESPQGSAQHHPSRGTGRGSVLAENPYAYIDANVIGTLVMLEAARRIDNLTRDHLCLVLLGLRRQHRSSRSASMIRVDQPVSLYAATKRSCELIAHTYSHLYGLPATGLRFFTVYGPWGRPDMAAYLFTRAILAGRTDQGLQRRPNGARFHLYRRYRRRHRRGA